MSSQPREFLLTDGAKSRIFGKTLIMLAIGLAVPAIIFFVLRKENMGPNHLLFFPFVGVGGMVSLITLFNARAYLRKTPKKIVLSEQGLKALFSNPNKNFNVSWQDLTDVVVWSGIGKNQPYIVYKTKSGTSSFIPGGMECNLLIVETLVARGIRFVIKEQNYHHPGNQENTVKFFGQSGLPPL